MAYTYWVTFLLLVNHTHTYLTLCSPCAPGPTFGKAPGPQGSCGFVVAPSLTAAPLSSPLSQLQLPGLLVSNCSQACSVYAVNF